MRVLAIDPGRITGYCYARIDAGKIYCAPFQMLDDVDDMWKRITEFNPIHLIIEDFEFRGGARKGLDLFSVQLIGVARLWYNTSKGDRGFFLQKASTGKAYYTDAILKKNKLYIRGCPHGMDATRHLLQWFTFGYGHQFQGRAPDFVSIVKREEI